MELTRQELKTFLDNNKRDYLELIYNDYNEYLTNDKKKEIVESKDKDIISIDDNFDRLRAVWNEEEVKNATVHGPHVFNDGKIHFYPEHFKSLESEYLKGILMHELLHFTIAPEKINIADKTKQEEIQKFTTEGLVDMVARDLITKYNLTDSYSSNYGKNVIFFREALGNIKDEKERYKLIFNGSIKDIYSKTSTPNFNSLFEAREVKNNKAWFQNEISTLSAKLMHGTIPKLEQKLIEELANYPNPKIGIQRMYKEKELMYKYLVTRDDFDTLNSNEYHDVLIHFLTNNKSLNELTKELDTLSKHDLDKTNIKTESRENVKTLKLTKNDKNGFIEIIPFLAILAITCVLTSAITLMILNK